MKDTILTIGEQRLKLEIWPLGARLNQVSFDGVGCLDASADCDEALGDKRYFGAVVGPVANRIAGGRVEIGGQHHELPRNENDVTLHGGPEGLHARDWTVVGTGESSATLMLDLADGECGLPGNRRFTARYAIEGDGFRVAFEAVSDAPTLVNLALHPYWVLDAGGRDGLEISVSADGYTPIDERKIPTGEVADVAGSIFDLRRLAAPSPDIDHNFVLTGADPAVVLASERLRLEIGTDAPGMQIFAGKANGIAIEPQHWPDTPHHPAFPPILLQPGETYRQTSTYRLSRR